MWSGVSINIGFKFSTARYDDFSVTPKLQQHFILLTLNSGSNEKLITSVSYWSTLWFHLLLLVIVSYYSVLIPCRLEKKTIEEFTPWILALAFYKRAEEELSGFACQVAARLFDSFWVSTPLGLRQLRKPWAMSPVACWRCSSTMAGIPWSDKRIRLGEAVLGSVIGFLGNYSWWIGCKKRCTHTGILLQSCQAPGSTWRRGFCHQSCFCISCFGNVGFGENFCWLTHAQTPFSKPGWSVKKTTDTFSPPVPSESPSIPRGPRSPPHPVVGVSTPEAPSVAGVQQDFTLSAPGAPAPPPAGTAAPLARPRPRRMGAALVRRGGCLLLWLALLLGCWAELGSGLEFPGAEGQWTRFPKWNACCESEMSFNMKTRSSSGLVLYFDDEGFCDFLELILTQGGRLQLSFSIFCAEPATLLSDMAVNDNLWHAVVIRRHFKNTTLIIDRAEAKWVEVKSKRRDMTVFSGLFLGGLPPELRSATLKLTLSSVKDREPFKGWITDVRVNYTQTSPVESQEVRLDDEQSRLCAREDVCLNGGVCSVLNDQAVCDCSQTGFRGKDCSEGKAPS